MRIALLILLLHTVLPLARAEQLPLKTYSSADGLASSVIHHIATDSKGFLWFCARGGLSRFDGYEFTSFRLTDDASPSLIHYFLETRDGVYWISADSGLYRVRPDNRADAFPTGSTTPAGERNLAATRVSNQVFITLFEDSRGNLWGGNDRLVRIDARDGDEVSIEPVNFASSDETRRRQIADFTETADGSVWAANGYSMIRIMPDGRPVSYEVPLAGKRDESFAIESDPSGLIWFSHVNGVFVFKPDSLDTASAGEVISPRVTDVTLATAGRIELPTESLQMIRLSSASRNPSETAASIEEIFRDRSGGVWLPSDRGLYVVDGPNYQLLRDTTQPLGAAKSIVEDIRNDVWFGNYGGVVKFRRYGLISYGPQSGLIDPVVHSITETSDGIYVFHGDWKISRLREGGFETVELNVPEGSRFSWTSIPIFADQNNSIWALTLNGLFRFSSAFSSLASSPPQQIAAPPSLDPTEPMYRAFRSRDGKFLYFSSRAGSGTDAGNGLFRMDLGSGQSEDLSAREGYPSGHAVAAFTEDLAGTIWLGFYGRPGLFRYSNERFTEVPTESGIPKANVLSLLTAGDGSIWVGTTGGGLGVIDFPLQDPIRAARYTETEGMSSNNVRCLTADRFGNIYAGTVRGVTRIISAERKLEKITTLDGLAADFVHSAFTANDGSIWFGTANGVSRYEPHRKQHLVPSPVLIRSLQIAGVTYDVSPFGQTRIANLEVSASENNIALDFFSIGTAEDLRYRYMLEGSGQDGWSEPSPQRSLNFGNLAPGSYRLLIQPITISHEAAGQTAEVAFVIRPPFWRTWWFLALTAALVGVGLLAFHKYRTGNLLRINAALSEAKLAEENLRKSREERLAELQRVRTRIATDLHDDIGASLTQIAVLSEVVRRNAIDKTEVPVAPLESISSVSNELVESMSDIVWAINPRKDSLRELVLRMRRFASDVLSARDIEFDFDSPDTGEETQLGANIRREIFSIFKESINNIVRHSGATRVSVELEVGSSELRIAIADNGKGFDARAVLGDDFSPDKGGNGLINIRRRAADLGGESSIRSSAAGTTVSISVPVGPPAASNGTTIQMDSDTGRYSA